MSVAIRSKRDAVLAVPDVYRFTVKQYHRMIETRVLTENDRVELLDGWIVPKMPHNPPHDGTVHRIHRRLQKEIDEDWLLRVQSAITTKESEPEPDIAVVSGPEEIYFVRHPEPEDIALLIEVSDATLDDDRNFKARLFARAKIKNYWIVNLLDRQIEAYSNPRPGRIAAYRRKKIYKINDEIPLVLDGKVVCFIPVRELLPPV